MTAYHACVPAPTLAYDDLPPGSDIRRVHEAHRIQITVPAADPPRAALKQAALDALAWGAVISAPVLLLAAIVFYLGIRANRVSGELLTLAYAFFAIFCAAIVMLISWVRYGMTADALRAGRLQATIIAATPQRLLIETAGPFGAVSYDLPREKIAAISIGGGVMEDDRRTLRPVRRLELKLTDGRLIRLLPGRDPRELRWVCGVIKHIMELK